MNSGLVLMTRTILLLVGILSACTRVLAAQAYLYTDIGIGTWRSLNNNGVAVGDVEVGGLKIPLLWANGRATQLSLGENSEASARTINDSGLIVGTNSRSAILWRSNGEPRSLPLPPGSGRFSYILPFDMNRSGAIVAQVRDDTFGGGWGSGRWSETQFERRLYGNVSAINNAGDTVGDVRSGSPGNLSNTAYFQKANGSVIIIGAPQAPGRISRFNSSASDLNDLGTVLLSGYLWRSGVFTSLGSFEGRRINNQGQVAGAVSGEAAVWSDGVITTLGPYLSAINGIRGSVAADINDAGQILVYVEKGNGQVQGSILTPVPAPVALTGSVGSGFRISIKKGSKAVTTLRAGRYKITINDNTSSHNFHLIGPGVDKKKPVFLPSRR